MEKNELTGIERDLVVQYLVDGNVPVTLTPSGQSEPDGIHAVPSAVFPVAISPAEMRVGQDGLMLLENPPRSVSSFPPGKVRVEFYFNRVGLCFDSDVKNTADGLVLKIPDTIGRIKDSPSRQVYDFTAMLYFDCRTKHDIRSVCVPWDGIQLFSRPVWKTIPLERQQEAKRILEEFVAQARTEGNAGNGLHLIPVCNYLTSGGYAMESVQDRIQPLSILYVDHLRIVLGAGRQNFSLMQGDEYALKMSFSMKSGPVSSRDIFLTCTVNRIFAGPDSGKYCADCVYTALQEEDLRFLYEKATKNLLG